MGILEGAAVARKRREARAGGEPRKVAGHDRGGAVAGRRKARWLSASGQTAIRAFRRERGRAVAAMRSRGIQASAARRGRGRRREDLGDV